MKAPLEGAPPNFLDFSGQKNYEESIFLATVTIVESFASHVPRRMQIMSSADGLQGHFQPVFLNFPTNFQHFFLPKLGVPSVDLGPQAISEALIAAFRTEDLQRAAS